MRIRFGAKEIEAKPGDTVGAALYRDGQRIFSRSFKYHRPRGLLCCAGKCPNCLMNVDGIPNVRTCITPARDGMVVKAQNAYPSLERDYLSISQRFDWLMPVGWYYKIFTEPADWHRAEPYIRRVAGLGEISKDAPGEYEHAWMHAETAVIGGGYAGLEAALEAAGRGDEVTLIDDQPELGGQARYRKSIAIPEDKIAQVKAHPNIRILQGSYCFGLYEGNLLGVLQPRPNEKAVERLIHLRARNIVVASGAYETPLIFPNNDLVGVMLSTAAQRLIKLYGIAPGKRAVVVGTAQRAEEIAGDLRAVGTEVVTIVAPEDVVAAGGSGAVSKIQTRVGGHSCDVLILCGPRVPDAGFAAQSGAKLNWSEPQGAFLPTRLPAGVTVVGDAAGESLTSSAESTLQPTKRSFVCLCSDVTTKDLCDGVAEGFDQIETLKRYTTATMGPCQGRMCQLAAIRVCSAETGRAMGETGVTTSRPPNPSVTLGALAGTRSHPVRRTAIHDAHDALGAVWLDMGDWKRPRYYRRSSGATERQSVEAEYRAVREGVGVIDVGTLGKLEMRGRDAGRLLDLVYTHRFSDLRPGRVRYALMCDESGVILDDGTISRLADNRYFITTTTGNLDFVHQQLESYLVGKRWDVHIVNQTAGYGSMNVAGPKARDVLSRLTETDLTTTSFPYMACREGAVAGVPAILLRIGFVGETGWEIHAAAESAESVWSALLESGAEFGILPFGVEAQRLLRLEKRHAIVGVDTDALAGPYESGMGWAARLDKDDFVGKVALTHAEHAAPRERLIGFIVKGEGIPEDGAAVVVDGKSAGRVTSCRYSPAKKAAIGLAWAPADKAQEGASIHVRVNGQLAQATVTMEAFYDPEGARLRQ